MRFLSALGSLLIVVSLPAIAPAGTDHAYARPAVSRAERTAATGHAGLADPVPCAGTCYHPTIRTSWQWQLQFAVDTSVPATMYDIDGFDAHAALVDELHDAGRKVVCYISAGSWENWRPDADEFPDAVLGRSNGWPGERWLDVRKLGLLAPIMMARLDMCETKGFDAVEFDNVDGYQNPTGFRLTGADQLRFNVFLANQAHVRGLTAALKNDLGQISTLVDYYDFALNEQCHQYHECDRLDRFVRAGKAVFGVEYRLAKPAFCPQANAHDFNFLQKRLSLGAWRRPCRPDPA
jgi:hypothetical protein